MFRVRMSQDALAGNEPSGLVAQACCGTAFSGSSTRYLQSAFAVASPKARTSVAFGHRRP
jgi:hypothetical protein